MKILSSKTHYLSLKLEIKPLITLLLVLLVIGCSQPKYSLMNGESQSIPNKDGWVLVNFWAPWCAPCIEEIPELNRLADEMPNPLVAVVGVYFDPISNKDLQLQIEKYQVTFSTLKQNQGQLPVNIPNMLPANFLVAPDGEIHGPLLGPQTYTSILKAISVYQNQSI